MYRQVHAQEKTQQNVYFKIISITNNRGGEGRVLPYIDYIGMCSLKRYGFLAV